MSTFNYDQKVKHETLAKQALETGNLKQGFHHICQAAMFSFLLAKSSEKEIGRNYLEQGNKLLELGRTLKEKINAAPSEAKKTAADGNGKENTEGTLFQSVETPNMKFADVADRKSVV